MLQSGGQCLDGDREAQHCGPGENGAAERIARAGAPAATMPKTFQQLQQLLKQEWVGAWALLACAVWQSRWQEKQQAARGARGPGGSGYSAGNRSTKRIHVLQQLLKPMGAVGMGMGAALQVHGRQLRGWWQRLPHRAGHSTARRSREAHGSHPHCPKAAGLGHLVCPLAVFCSQTCNVANQLHHACTLVGSLVAPNTQYGAMPVPCRSDRTRATAQPADSKARIWPCCSQTRNVVS